MNEKNCFYKFNVFVIEFVIFSFLGWAYETVYTSVLWGEFAKRGFLHIPVCPIYGFFCFALIAIFSSKKLKNPFLIFVASTILIGTLEYLASYIIEKALNESLWDYSYMNWHINGRVSIVICLCFGLASVLLIKLVHPLLFKFFSKKLSKAAAFITALILIAIIFTDTAVTMIQ